MNKIGALNWILVNHYVISLLGTSFVSAREKEIKQRVKSEKGDGIGGIWGKIYLLLLGINRHILK